MNQTLVTEKEFGTSDLLIKGSKNLIISVGNILAECIYASKILKNNYKVE